MSVVWWLPTKGKVDKACRNNYRTTFCIVIWIICIFPPLKLHIAEHPAGHLVLKWLIEQDEKMQESGKEGMFEIQF